MKRASRRRAKSAVRNLKRREHACIEISKPRIARHARAVDNKRRPPRAMRLRNNARQHSFAINLAAATQLTDVAHAQRFSANARAGCYGETRFGKLLENNQRAANVSAARTNERSIACKPQKTTMRNCNCRGEKGRGRNDKTFLSQQPRDRFSSASVDGARHYA